MWRKIPSTNGLYFASNIGEIKRRISFVSNQPSNKKSGYRKVGGKILSPKTKKNGYMEVSLHFGKGKHISRYVHRLIAESFLGTIPKGYVINHKDGNKQNNNISNLEIVTYSQNSLHAYKNGLSSNPSFCGEEHPRAKLKNHKILEMRKIYNRTHSIKKVHSIFPNVPKSTISKVVYRVTWKHI